MMVVAASGSVGETTAPRAKAAAHGIPSTSSCATRATAHIVNSTSPTALMVIPPQVAPHRLQIGEERRRVQERREEEQQDDVGVELDLGHARDEPENQAAHDQHDRVRDPHQPRDGAQHDDRDEQPGEQVLDLSHRRDFALVRFVRGARRPARPPRGRCPGWDRTW